MDLTPAQQATLQTDILVTHQAEFAAMVAAADHQLIADAYNLAQTPDYWAWKTLLSHAECVGVTSVDGTNWSWPLYHAQPEEKRDGWKLMFAPARQGDPPSINASLPNIRQGIADIFPAGAQRTHLLAIARRKALRIERLFATGTGSTASPGVLTFEGTLTYLDIAETLREEA
jgi:hypothetical protein